MVSLPKLSESCMAMRSCMCGIWSWAQGFVSMEVLISITTLGGEGSDSREEGYIPPQSLIALVFPYASMKGSWSTMML